MQDVADEQLFTSDVIHTIARIWSRATITLIDVRYKDIYMQSPILQYQMPSSTLIYIYGGSATVRLDDATFMMERFGIVHGGKGTTVTILPGSDKLGAYMVFYKGETLTRLQWELQRLIEEVNPFTQKFGYLPSNPIHLIDLLQRMVDCWNSKKALGQLQAKSIFYQLMHHTYGDLEQKEARFLSLDPALSAKRYLEKHYMDPIMFQEIAKMFGISAGQLTRLFKKREGMSLQEYLIQKRLAAATHYLVQTDMIIKDIAIGCGFSDENNLLRSFKKHYKMSPSEYRKINTLSMQVHAVDNDSQRLYNSKGLTEIAKYERDGEFTMLGQIRSKQVILAAAMSLMLLLSACSGASNGGNSTQSPAPTTQQTQTETQVSSNKEVRETATVAQTRAVRTEKGVIDVPMNPERVIVDGPIRGDVIALGVMPIATQNFYNTGVAYEHLTKEVTILEKWESEYIMAENPDLIITMYEDQIDEFSKIAPTIYVPHELSEEERVRLVAEALGKTADGEKWIDDYKQKVADAKKQLEATGLYEKTFSVIRTEGNNLYGVRFGNKLGGQILYDAFELPKPEAVLKEIETGEPVGGTFSLEILAQYMGDYILINEDIGGIESLADDPVWNSIPAVKAEQLIVVPASYFYFWDIYSKSAQVDFLLEELLSIAQK